MMIELKLPILFFNKIDLRIGDILLKEITQILFFYYGPHQGQLCFVQTFVLHPRYLSSVLRLEEFKEAAEKIHDQGNVELVELRQTFNVKSTVDTSVKEWFRCYCGYTVRPTPQIIDEIQSRFKRDEARLPTVARLA